MSMIIFYVVYFFLIIRFAIALFNFISNPKLPRSPKKHMAKVSVLIPLTGSAESLKPLLDSISSQDYTNYEVLIFHDQAEEDTLSMHHLKSLYPHLRLIKGSTAHRGWTNHNYASLQLANAAKGEYLLFTTPKALFNTGLINNTVHRMKIGKLAFFSLIADGYPSSKNNVLFPLLHYILLTILPLRLVQLSKSPFFRFADPNFLLFDAGTYRKHQWHAQIKDKAAAGTSLIKLVKAYRYRTEVLLANGFLYSLQPANLHEEVLSLSKRLYNGFNNNTAAVFCYLLLLIAGPLFIAVYLPLQLILFYLTLVVLTRLLTSLSSGQNPLINIILHPFQMLMLVWSSLNKKENANA